LGQDELALRTHVDPTRLTVTAAKGPRFTLSEQAAEHLLPAAARQRDAEIYLAALVVHPRYGRWAEQFVPLAGTLTTEEGQLGWAEIPPEFTELQISGEGAQRQIRRVRLEDITQAVERHPALVLLGEPGAGKTTTLYRLLLDAARQCLDTGDGKLPLLLPLADYRDYASPYDFVEAKWQQWLGLPDLTQRLRDGKLFLLCDALNEMPFGDARDYRERVAAWRRFTQEWPGNRMLFTCRSRNYSEPLGLPQVEIRRLDNKRVRDFLDRYLPEDLAEDAWSQLRDSPLLELVRNPYYLKMLAYLLVRGGGWPDSRARLFDGFVHTLVKREQSRQHPHWPGQQVLLRALEMLAEAMQPLGEGTRLPRSEVLKRLPQRIQGPNGPVATVPGTILDLGLSASLLDTELNPKDEQQLRFYHHQLQEYFAARALLQRFEQGENLDSRWVSPRLVRDMPDPGPLRADEPLPPPPSSGWEEPTVLAVGLSRDHPGFLESVRRVNPVLAVRCLTETGLDVSAELKGRLQQDLLRDMENDQVHLRVRIEAGEALARLGDPRFQTMTINGHQVMLPPLVSIPAGSVSMGSGIWEVWRLSRSGYPAQDERPRHVVQLPAFAVGKYPVTNAEYACFIDAAGYGQKHWWEGTQARAWLGGASAGGVVEDIIELWRGLKQEPERMQGLGWSEATIAQWQGLLTLDEKSFREVAEKSYADRPRDRPAYWEDDRFNNPAQPVVGVNWFEARAYCAWLNVQLHEGSDTALKQTMKGRQLRLPTEAEWERAAREGTHRRYPWGRRWWSDCANTEETHLLRTTPVGIFPSGTTAAGIHELAGNVWEWTSSHYQPYPYRIGDGRNDTDAEGPLVVRGGSWGYNLRRSRCAVRDWNPPEFFNDVVGFRVVLSLADSEC
jgi:formylglycine-generating enzyme required for sulfatase activity